MYQEIDETWFLDQVFLNPPNNHLDDSSQGQFAKKKKRLEKKDSIDNTDVCVNSTYC